MREQQPERCIAIERHKMTPVSMPSDNNNPTLFKYDKRRRVDCQTHAIMTHSAKNSRARSTALERIDTFKLIIIIIRLTSQTTEL